MQIKQEVLRGIAAGEITVLFRRWQRPRVKVGTALRTAVGLVEVTSVDVVDLDDLTDADARRAGFADVTHLLAWMRDGDDPVFRIGVAPAGEDPRVALRARADLDDDEVADLRARLDRYDRASRHGPWTARTLSAIAQRPDTPARDLAGDLDLEVPVFKRNVRKLKELGLTESRNPGYRLSARGEAFLARS